MTATPVAQLRHLPTTLTVRIPFDLTDQTLSGLWTPNAAEREAAWEMCIELSTRVTVVPLRDNEGLLGEALASLHSIFGETRTILRKYGSDLAEYRRGELSFAVLAGYLLNQIIRPVTSFWHPQLEQFMSTRKASEGKREFEASWPLSAQLRILLDQLRQPVTAFAQLFAEASGAGEFLRIQLDNETRLYERLSRMRLQEGLADAQKTSLQFAGQIATLHTQLEQTMASLGPDAEQTLGLRDNLAWAYDQHQEPGKAAELMEQSVVESIRVLGRDDPRTLTRRSSLCEIRIRMVDTMGAPAAGILPLLEEDCAETTRVLGPEDPASLWAVQRLALALHLLRDDQRALPLAEKNAADRTRLLGPDTYDTFASRNLLAQIYGSVAPVKAVEAFESLYNDSLRVFGPDARNTMMGMYNLAWACAQTGDNKRAVSLYEQALRDRRRVLGQGDPDTVVSCNGLAVAYANNGNFEAAILKWQELVQVLTELQRPDDEVAGAQLFIAQALFDLNRQDEAAAFLATTAKQYAVGTPERKRFSAAARRLKQGESPLPRVST